MTGKNPLRRVWYRIDVATKWSMEIQHSRVNPTLARRSDQGGCLSYTSVFLRMLFLTDGVSCCITKSAISLAPCRQRTNVGFLVRTVYSSHIIIIYFSI